MASRATVILPSLAFRVSFFWFGFQSYYFLSLAFRVSFLVWLPELLFSSLMFRVSFLVWLSELFSQFSI